ncbi:MAG: NB-ARC domain-containing protein, partial [Cyanobacteria bacterium P01_F01_bin.143]
MSDAKTSEQQLQSILKNISVGGNLTTGDISQILNLFVIVHQPNSFIPKSTPYNIPSSNTIKFVGRADALEQLHQALQQNSQVAITAIEGMGGVGKTELATQYSLLHLILKTYPGGICWLRARDEDIGIQILHFAEAKLGIKPPEDWELKDKVDFCWSRWREKKEGNVLIVLDDVNDYPKIQSYLPPQLSQFKVLITTRLQLDLPQSFSLDILSESASLELLRQWIGEEKVNQKLVISKELCLLLGYLPLALNLVGRYVQKREISVAEMLVRLEREGLQHRALDVHGKDHTRTLNIQRGVAAAFELSWEELSREAKVLGCLLSLFALAPIPWSLVENINIHLDKEELEDAKVELNDLNLIQDKSPYILHQLIRDFFRSKIDSYELRKNDFVRQAFVQGITSFISKKKITNNKKEHTLTLIPHIAESAIV